MNSSCEKLTIVLLILAFAALGCRHAEAEPPESAPSTPEPQPVVVTLTPRSSDARPIAPPRPTPTRLPATATQAPPTPTPVPPTPTPSPTMNIQDWHEAFKYQSHGDYDRAIRGYRTLLAAQPADEDARSIRFHLGESYLLNDDPATASVVLADYVADYPDDSTAWFVLGRTREMLQDWVGAVEAFRTYRELDDTLGDYAGLRIAAALQALNRIEEAVKEYENVAQIAADADLAVAALEGLAEIALTRNDPATAAKRYAQAANRSPEETEKARLLGLAGTSYLAADQVVDAASVLRNVVEKYPASASAYMAVGELLSLEEPVNERMQGLVYYYNGDYAAAVDALSSYLVTEPAPLGDTLYFLGRSYEGLGRWSSAINAYEELIANYPGNDRYGAAWVRKARAQLRLGDAEQAVTTFREFAEQHPNDILADNALWEAARALEGLGRRSEAAEVYRVIVNRYPNGDVGAEAGFRVGILPYLDDEYATAYEAWQLAAKQAETAEGRARMLLWAGKAALALGDADSAENDLSTAARIAPLNFDGLRAQMLLDDENTPAVVQAAVDRPALSNWLGLSEETLTNIDQWLQSDRQYQRGRVLLAVGLRDEGLAKLRELRNAYWNKPAHLSRLALLLDDPSSRHLSIASAERALILTGTSPLDAPAEIAQLAYPIDYRELLLDQATSYNLDPRLLAALIRQESRFDPTATSYASARGLTQVIPSTGWYIAGKLGLPSFDVVSLYRPHRSIEFGAWYLDEQLDRFDDTILALAAYNGGPGNSRRWQRLTEDVDILVASIHLDQTEEYVRRVIEQYAVYQALYDEELTAISEQ